MQLLLFPRGLSERFWASAGCFQTNSMLCPGCELSSHSSRAGEGRRSAELGAGLQQHAGQGHSLAGKVASDWLAAGGTALPSVLEGHSGEQCRAQDSNSRCPLP